jgi:hypothetical protein
VLYPIFQENTGISYLNLWEYLPWHTSFQQSNFIVTEQNRGSKTSAQQMTSWPSWSEPCWMERQLKSYSCWQNKRTNLSLYLFLTRGTSGEDWNCFGSISHSLSLMHTFWFPLKASFDDFFLQVNAQVNFLFFDHAHIIYLRILSVMNHFFVM